MNRRVTYLLASPHFRIFLAAAVLAFGWWAWITWRPGSQARWQAQMAAGKSATREGDYISAEHAYLQAVDEARRLRPPSAKLGHSYARLYYVYLYEGYRLPSLVVTPRHVAEEVWRSRDEGLPVMWLRFQHGRQMLHAQRNYGRELTMLPLAEAAYRRAYPPRDPHLAIAFHDLAGCYATSHRYREELRLHKEGLAVCERAYGPDSPMLSLSLTQLAMTYDRLNRSAEAKATSLRAAELRERAGRKSIAPSRNL